ncbi:hypothetical protein DH2020_034953 [Rehmannia glutinosa]|uniref:GRF-type domain-containing protein n=1 Tax=Rehmannia glutinosa TaxID=99300 RepID=A0ABR0V7V1_REHGL
MWRQTAEFSVNDKCECEKLIVKKTSWSDLNPGRKYVACEKFREVGGCTYFSWIDPPTCARARQIVPGLLRRANRFEDELKRLEKEFKRLEEELKRKEDELKVKEDLFKRKRSREKWLWMALLFSWIVMYLLN